MTRQEVKEKYKLVSLHDRVGRMADTHEFEILAFPLERIHPELLTELRNTVNSLIEITEKKAYNQTFIHRTKNDSIKHFSRTM